MAGVRNNSSVVGRLEIGSDAVEAEALENEGGLGLCGRVDFDLCSRFTGSAASAVESPPALCGFFGCFGLSLSESP